MVLLVLFLSKSGFLMSQKTQYIWLVSAMVETEAFQDRGRWLISGFLHNFYPGKS